MNPRLKLLFPRLLVAANGIIIALFSAYFVNAKYPEIGFDYKYFIPRLIDTHLHYRINGLSIQWYTPSFGGGLPAYPNPQQIQFSLTQFLTLLVNPWSAILISIVCFALLGYFGAYLLIHSVLGFHWAVGMLGAVFFSINGFFLGHLGAGHLGYLAYPLLPFFLIALLSPSIPFQAAGVILSLLFGIFIYSGGFYSSRNHPALYIDQPAADLSCTASIIRMATPVSYHSIRNDLGASPSWFQTMGSMVLHAFLSHALPSINIL